MSVLRDAALLSTNEFSMPTTPAPRQWLFAPHEHAIKQTVFVGVVIEVGAMQGGPVVPQQHVALAPLVAVDELRARRVLEQLGQQRLRFDRAHADDVLGLHRMEIQRAHAIVRIRAHERLKHAFGILSACASADCPERRDAGDPETR